MCIDCAVPLCSVDVPLSNLASRAIGTSEAAMRPCQVHRPFEVRFCCRATSLSSHFVARSSTDEISCATQLTLITLHAETRAVVCFNSNDLSSGCGVSKGVHRLWCARCNVNGGTNACERAAARNSDISHACVHLISAMGVSDSHRSCMNVNRSARNTHTRRDESEHPELSCVQIGRNCALCAVCLSDLK